MTKSNSIANVINFFLYISLIVWHSQNDAPKNLPKKNPVIKLSESLNPRKRKFDNVEADDLRNTKKPFNVKERVKPNDYNFGFPAGDAGYSKNLTTVTETDKKKYEAERKRMESMKKKRQEFKEKQMIIKTGLTGVVSSFSL